MDALLQGVITISPEGNIAMINDEACRLLGTSPAICRGLPTAALVPGERHPMLEVIEEVRRRRRPIVQDEVTLRRRSGGPLVADLSVSPLLLEGEDGGVVVVLRDRSPFRQLLDETSQREHLASYGQIAAGIAHEVKNPLSGIRGAAELLEVRAENVKARKTAQLIVREVDRITSLVNELMVFARGEKLDSVTLNIHRVIDGVIELIEAEPAAANIVIERIYDPSIPDLQGDPNRLTQVFLNLARNAVQAMGDTGGTLTLTTRVEIEDRLMGTDGHRRSTIAICFEDDGKSLPPEEIAKLTTPFFTTRTEGTGLGLAISKHWVSRHEGRLLIEASENRGVRVRVLLPLGKLPDAGRRKEIKNEGQ